MKHLKLLLLFTLLSAFTFGQKTSTLPSSGTIQVQSYLSPDGKTRIGNAAKGFEVVAKQTSLDSVLNNINQVKPQKVHQVYWMGNSLTANGYAGVNLGNLLGSKWHVNNLGIQGDNTAGMLTRFSKQVTSKSDAEYVVILGGINDVISGSTAASIQGNLQTMYTAAHNAGIKVVAATILPFKGNSNWTSGKQTVLETVNAWILNTATNIDYKVDTYSTFNDPDNPGMMLPVYYGTDPDYLHPNVVGYNHLGEYIFSNAIWLPFATVNTLGVTNNISLNQNLRTTDSPNFADLILVSGKKEGTSDGQTRGGNLYLPQSTALNGIIFNDSVPAVYFPGTGNTAIGKASSPLSATGTYNVNIGYGSGRNISTSGFNTIIGAFSGFNTSTSSGSGGNTYLGYQSGFTGTTSTRNVMLGFGAGYYETGSSKLFIDNSVRLNEADARVNALLYGEFDAVAADQRLYVNGKLYTPIGFIASSSSMTGVLTSKQILSDVAETNTVNIGDVAIGSTGYFLGGYNGYWGVRQGLDHSVNIDVYNGGTPINAAKISQDGRTKLLKLNVGTTTDYADNAAALAGGLVAGDVYRTGDLLKVVH